MRCRRPGRRAALSGPDPAQTLFYKLVSQHLKEMAPKIYTPVVADACKYWSHIYRRSRGLYISLSDRGRIARGRRRGRAQARR